jgi:hypothetical protein
MIIRQYDTPVLNICLAQLGDYYYNLTNLIQYTRQLTGRKAIIVTHSNGGHVLTYFL